jgi:hypothetical protein
MPKKTITVVIEEAQLADLQHAFPELEAGECAARVATFATAEMIALFAGKKRYLSLSHQYIEWLEKMNAELLPEVEFTPRRLMNQFYFPPGSASYISRVLRDRQNVVIMGRTWTTLLKKFKDVKKLHDDTPQNQRGGVGNLWSITLTKREYRQLEILLEEFEALELAKPLGKRESINLPEVGEIRMDYMKIKYKMTVIEKLIPLLEERQK